jgi:hypothetical protein
MLLAMAPAEAAVITVPRAIVIAILLMLIVVLQNVN